MPRRASMAWYRGLESFGAGSVARAGAGTAGLAGAHRPLRSASSRRRFAVEAIAASPLRDVPSIDGRPPLNGCQDPGRGEDDRSVAHGISRTNLVEPRFPGFAREAWRPGLTRNQF